MPSIVKRIQALFSGLLRAHGEFQIVGVDEGKKKITGRAITHRSPVTEELWEDHLAGEYGLGIVPITDKATCKWGVIDIDIPGIDLVALERKCIELNLPVIVCRSKSKGAHIFLFARDFIPAKLVRGKLLEWSVSLGHGGVEVFPKQVKLADTNDVGNWLNMPYYGGSHRVAIIDGKDAPIEQFLDYAETIAVTQEELQAKEVVSDEEYFLDGPPCLQTLAREGFTEGQRNDGLFSVGVYLRQKYPDDWETKFYEANNALMEPPLFPPEMIQLVKSLSRKNYYYKCNQPPLSTVCNRDVCRARKYGIGADNTKLEASIGPLSKIDGDPPIWYLEVDAIRVELSIEELMSFRSVKIKCMNAVNKHIGNMRQQDWDEKVREMMKTLEIIDVPEDAGTEGQFKVLTHSFLTRRKQSARMDDILNGQPYYDPEKEQYFFRSQDLEGYLKRRNFYKYTTTEIFAKLRDMGAEHDRLRLKGEQVRVWTIPPIYTAQDQDFDVPDFSSEEF